MFSLGPKKILGNLLLGNLCALDEVISTGRSGSFFFKTHDQKYFIKTLPTAEESFLFSHLKDYLEYLEENPNTLLPRFYVHFFKIDLFLICFFLLPFSLKKLGIVSNQATKWEINTLCDNGECV